MLIKSTKRQCIGKNMKKFLTLFYANESGAVTVDFVVLTAAITMLGLTVVTAFSPGATGLANKIENSLDNVEAE
jgi:Flp pilus assembly pilin Flp